MNSDLEWLQRAYVRCGEGVDLPTLHVMGLKEYRKRKLCEEKGWPEGRPTWEEFWRNDFGGLVSLKAALGAREVHHGLDGDVPTCGDRAFS